LCLFSTGSIRLPEESIFLSPLIQYDNPIYQEESPPLSERLKSLEKNMRALSPIPVNVVPLRSPQKVSPSKPSNVSTMILEFENLRCTTPEREVSLSDEGPSTQSPDVSTPLAAPSDSGSLTPFQQFQHRNPDLQVNFCIRPCLFYSLCNWVALLLEKKISNSDAPKCETTS
jgi:hypothetical protein